MKENYIHHYNYFYGAKVSEYGLENGFIDYACLAKAMGDIVLNNNIVRNTYELGYWDEFNGSQYDEENDEYKEIYQFYIITENGAELLSRYTDEIIFYNEYLDMYVWGITHLGTSWDYVLTGIHCDYEKE